MPTFDYQDLVQRLQAGLVKGGFREAEAGVVAAHLVDAESKGMTSHGILRVPQYLEQAREGRISLSATPRVTAVNGGVTTLDGDGGLGILAFEQALDLGMAAAEQQNCAAVAVVNCGHTGRIGAYVERAARNGFMAIALGGGGSGKDWAKVVPFGGTRPVMSTNPYALSMPSRGHGPVYADFATSAVAEGKVKLAQTKGQQLPPGSIIDSAGQPSQNPSDLYQGGALLTAAGPKGSGLGMIAELAALAMLAPAREFNWLLILLKVSALGNPDYEAAADSFLERVKNTPPAAGHDAVLLPGEFETAKAKAARETGIEVPESVWAAVSAVL